MEAQEGYTSSPRYITENWGSSRVAQQVKKPALPQLWCWLQLWCRFDPCLRDFHMPQGWPKREKKKEMGSRHLNYAKKCVLGSTPYTQFFVVVVVFIRVTHLVSGPTEAQVLCVSLQKEFSERQSNREEINLLG